MACIARIVSTARYLPERVVTNADLTARFTALGKPTVIDRLAASTGITKRFYVPDDWVTSDLTLPAAKEALLVRRCRSAEHDEVAGDVDSRQAAQGARSGPVEGISPRQARL
jgi:3-oxoacyl-[acyl-carrier-protein] synthase III